MKKRRTEITIETRTVTVVRTRNAPLIYCEICREEVQFFSPPQVISVFSLKADEIKRLFLADEIHCVALTEMMCGNSIAEYFRNN